MKKIFSIVLVLACSTFASAQSTRIATGEDVNLLKTDVLLGKIKVGKTRLKQIRSVYGDAPNITDSDSRLSYDYGDLKIAFDKRKYLINTENDYSQANVYSDDVEDLRSDLADGQLVGDFITADMIRKNYGVPTRAVETDEDGGLTIYYYGQIKLTFENTIVVENWRGSGLDKAAAKELLEGKVLGSAKNEAVPEAKITPPADAKVPGQ